MSEAQSEALIFIDVSSSGEITDGTKEEANPDQKTIEPSSQKQRCKECMWTGDAEAMVRHVRKNHLGQNPFQCSMCEYSAYNKTRFEEHVNKHRGIKPYKCSHCPYSSVSKKYMKKHESRHAPDNPFKCPHCPYIARYSRSLALHVESNHPAHQQGSSEDTDPCRDCKRTFTAAELLRHLKNRKQCKICSMVVCCQLYGQHMRKLHGKSLKVKAVQEARSQFKCALCPWKSNFPVKVLLHLIHHPKQKVNEDVFDVSVLRQCGIEVGV